MQDFLGGCFSHFLTLSRPECPCQAFGVYQVPALDRLWAGPAEWSALSLAILPSVLISAGLAVQRAVGVLVLVTLGASGIGLLPPISFLVCSCRGCG